MKPGVWYFLILLISATFVHAQSQTYDCSTCEKRTFVGANGTPMYFAACLGQFDGSIPNCQVITFDDGGKECSSFNYVNNSYCGDNFGPAPRPIIWNPPIQPLITHLITPPRFTPTLDELLTEVRESAKDTRCAAQVL